MVEDAALESLVALSTGLTLFVPAHTQLKLHSAVAAQDDQADELPTCNVLAYAAMANDSMYGEVSITPLTSPTGNSSQEAFSLQSD